MWKWLKRVLVVLLVLFVALTGIGAWLLRGSIPELDGEVALTGLSAPATIHRDALGVVTIDAANAVDAARALGYVHAQERYFEMDLLRRTAAGELSELFGPVAIDYDKQHRVHRMRARVDAQLDAILGDHRAEVDAYVDGVNTGLGALRTRPWPYLLVRQQPRPWQAADTALTSFAMYFDLQDAANSRELALWRLKPHLPPALYALLTREGTRWDAPLMGTVRGDAVLPTAQEVDLRTLPMPEEHRTGSTGEDIVPGSNNFAVAGARTADGRAIVADDMHLGLRVPALWFRARLRYPDPKAPGGRVDVTGFSLPGLPAIVVGSTGRIAWAFTNSYVDMADWRVTRACDAKTTTDCDTPAVHRETIRVAGEAAVDFKVEETSWGPVLERDTDGRLLSVRWNGHLPGALNFGLGDFVHARDLDDALGIADRTALPTQNLLVGDSTGRIAWRLVGPLPERAPGCSGELPRDGSGAVARTASAATASAVSPATVSATSPTSSGTTTTAAVPTQAACAPWSISTRISPALVDPPSGRLWTANNRTTDGETLRRLGDNGYVMGARPKQIRDGLFARERFAERDLLAIQLDDRALLMRDWWQVLHDAARRADRARTPALQALAQAARTAPERASADAVSYRLVRAWRLAVHQRIASGLTAPAQVALGKAFVMPDFQQIEGVVRPLLQERPAHLLPRRYASWDALLEDAAGEVRRTLEAQGPLAQRTWGEQNTAAICHPLAKALPLLGKRLLCMPADPLAGDGAMPRVTAPAFGASERMVVSPGHEADGITHMPGGQSGHPLSPFWGAGHEDWVQGRPTPFLPGATVHTLHLRPAR